MSFSVDKLRTLSDPSPVEAANNILNGVTADNMITIHGLCTTKYSGRAAGGLDEGERVVLIKPKSGTMMVHGEEGFKPLNWQPSGAEISADVEGGSLVVHAETSESLRVTFEELFQVTVFNNTDNAELRLEGTEEEMHQRILSEPHLVEEGLHSLEHEKEFDFGRVDVFGMDAEGNTVIIEVKRRSATRDHVYQLYTYVMEYRETFGDDVRGILVAPECTEYILDVLESYDLEFSELNPI